MTGIFIDGPLAQEVRSIPCAPVYRVPIPKRFTICDCDEDYPDTFEQPAEIVDYYVVARSITGHIALLSIKNDDDAIVNALKQWVITDLSKDSWSRDCRSRRAFT